MFLASETTLKKNEGRWITVNHEKFIAKPHLNTVYPKKYAHGFVVLCFVVVMQSFIMNSHEVFIHIHQGCFAGTGAIGRLPQCQWSKPDGYGKISQCITTTKHSKAKTVCIFLGIYCNVQKMLWMIIWDMLQVKLHDVSFHYDAIKFRVAGHLCREFTRHCNVTVWTSQHKTAITSVH